MGPDNLRVPENLHFGGGAEDTALYPIVAVCLLLAIVLVLVLPRNKAIAPFLFAFFIIPIQQVVVLGGLHFTALRFLILAGLVKRVVARKAPSDRFCGVDWAVVLFSISAAVCFCLEYRETGAIVRQAGNLLDTLGGYLVLRFLVPDGEAMRRTFKTLAAVSLVLGICMAYEQVGHRNVFGYVGYLSVEVVVRNGRVRSGGTLGCLHAGAFAGALIPVFFWLWKEGKHRLSAYAGLIGATTMVITSNSSTSVLAFAASIASLAFWPLRSQMRLVRWAFVSVLLGLQLVMKAPVWALIQRINLTGASSGFQRFMLVDMTIRHFSDWWLVGTKEYVTWGWESWDLCNQFVSVALTGGLLSLIFYILIFQRCFSAIGKARKLVVGKPDQELLMWCLGSALFATVIAHFGINYMAQLIMAFFALVACIVVATFEVRQTAPENALAPAHTPFASRLGVPRPSSPFGKTQNEVGHSVSGGKRSHPAKA